MVSTLVILFASVLCLLLVWAVVRPGLPRIRSLDDWEARKHDVDVDAFRLLLDPAEEQYLRRSLPPPQFRSFQRRRLKLALDSLDLVGKNVAMLMKLGQLAKTGGDARLTQQAEELIYGTLRLRVNLSLVQPCLWLKWLFPGWRVSIPAFAIPYEELLDYLNRVRQERQWNVDRVLIAG
jgi:hypothetical protein